MGSATARPLPPQEEVNVALERVTSVLNGSILSIVYQPVVDIRSGAIVGAEALARFNSEPHRSPDQWFDEAWAAGVGLEMELLAIRRALDGLAHFPANAYVAINTAPATLCSAELLEILTPVPRGRVVVELTEHTRVDDYDALIAAIARLRSIGVRLSIDDAGAGFSSFQHVLRLQPNIIKLDRSLTTKVDQNPIRASLATALVTFAASLGAQICAEGIETQSELVALQKLGVAYGQGYFLARPGALPLPEPPAGVWTTRYAAGLEASPEVRNGRRLAALDSTSLLDSAPEEEFDRFTRLVTHLLDVPVALVALVDSDRQFFKSAVGLAEPLASARETPLTHSFCQHAVTTRLPLVIDDAANHPLVHDNGAVVEIGVAAYAGIPLITAEGEALGALCAVDFQPRTWTEREINALKDLTALLVGQIELGRLRRLTNVAT